MVFKIRFKSFFVILIVIIFAVLIVNYYTKNKNVEFKKAVNANISNKAKTVGVKIEHNQLNGEKIEIKADEMIEDEKKNIIKFVNPKTTIIKNNQKTEITSMMGFVKNNNNEFFLENDVKISNLTKNFFLRATNLKGFFNSGKMDTKENVDVQVQNISIKGSGLHLKNFGDYIKIYGKAKLSIN